jgi:nucleoside-diphosphate-sugar epimerase
MRLCQTKMRFTSTALKDVEPRSYKWLNDHKIFITGANGQLGTALRKKYPKARFADINELDITNRDSVAKFDWSSIDIIINAAAFTNVDGAETLRRPHNCLASVNASPSLFCLK